MFKLNDPVLILGREKGYFECYLDDRNPSQGVRVGVRPGFGAVIPTSWIEPFEEK